MTNFELDEKGRLLKNGKPVPFTRLLSTLRSPLVVKAYPEFAELTAALSSVAFKKPKHTFEILVVVNSQGNVTVRAKRDLGNDGIYRELSRLKVKDEFEPLVMRFAHMVAQDYDYICRLSFKTKVLRDVCSRIADSILSGVHMTVIVDAYFNIHYFQQKVGSSRTVNTYEVNARHEILAKILQKEVDTDLAKLAEKYGMSVL